MNEQYFESLSRSLRRRGVSAGVVGRLVGELRDHAQDAEDDERSRRPSVAEAPPAIMDRFGTPDSLADSLVEGYRENSFLWRHPVLGFGVGPILLVVALLATPFFLGLFCRFDDGLSRIFWMDLKMSRMEIMSFLSACGAFLTFFAPAAAGLVFAWWGGRSLCPLRYLAVALFLLAAIGFLLVIRFDMIPPLTPDRAFSFAYSIGFGFPSNVPLINIAAGLFPAGLYLLLHGKPPRIGTA